MTLQEFISLLKKVRKNGAGYMAQCPCHDDQKQSLSVKEKDGKILVNCFAECDVQNVVLALGIELKDLFVKSIQNRQTNITQFGRIVAVYDYADETGEILYQNVRYEPKGFTQRKPNAAGGYDYNLKNTKRVPYRLPELIDAVRQEADIWLSEGEKDADNLRTLGFAATSFKNWKQEFNAYLKNSHVYLIFDHDKAGLKQGIDTAKLLFGNVASLKVISLFSDEPLPEKHGKDVTDFIKACAEDENLSNEEISERLCIFADNANAWQSTQGTELNAEIIEIEEIPIEIKPFPQPHEKCFHGLAGDYVRFIEPHTEADKMALLIQFLAYFGNIIGRSAFFQVEGNRHFTNLFSVLVGDTASGRKGTSFGRVKEVFKDLDELHEKECLVSGLASGEGLLYHVRDPQYIQKKNKETGELEEILNDGGVLDKRLLITEGEFANVLRVQGREGNTLSAFLRNLWDNGNARSLTKNSPLKTTDAHVSIVGHITKSELLTCLSEVESSNGYANRFLWVCVRRSKFLPVGSNVDLMDLKCITAEISRRIEFAKNIGQLLFSEDAKQLWIASYKYLETSRFGFVAKVTQRASPYVLRLSCIFAVLDAQTLIKREHLEAALAVWQFCEDSAKYIFGERLGNKNADAILDALREAENGLTRSEIYTRVFQNNLDANEIKKALQVLVECDLIESQMDQMKNAKRLPERWFLKTSSLRI